MCVVPACPCADEISPIVGRLVRVNIGLRSRRVAGQVRNRHDAPSSRSTSPSGESSPIGAAMAMATAAVVVELPAGTVEGVGDDGGGGGGGEGAVKRKSRRERSGQEHGCAIL